MLHPSQPVVALTLTAMPAASQISRTSTPTYAMQAGISAR